MKYPAGDGRGIAPFLSSKVFILRVVDLAYPLQAASQLRDSAGITPASHTLTVIELAE
jgi:hypothetical protein